MYEATSELSGQNVEKKGKGDWIMAVHFVKQMSSDFNI